MNAAHVEQLRDQGYAILRGFLPPAEVAALRAETDRIEAEALRHRASYRDRNLYFEILDDPRAGRKVVLQAHWFSWINPAMEALRRDPRYLEALGPLLGHDIKQIANQIHWKPPGAKYTRYRFHQDLRFRERPELYRDLLGGYVTTGLAIDRQDAENGALEVFPGSHKLGYLGLSDDGPIMVGETQEVELRRAGLDPGAALVCEMEPGDLLLWTLYTVHGSGPNRAVRDRCFMINSYVRAADSPERGEWAFRGGMSVPLGPEPAICRYEDLKERPGPFYVDDDWTEEARARRSGRSG